MPDLPTYDPHWERRWREALARVEALPADADHSQHRALLEAVYQAHDAQFQTLQALIDWRVGFIKAQAVKAGFLLVFAPFASDATIDDVNTACARAGAQIEAAKRAAKRPPLEHPQGLAAFLPKPAAGVRRDWLELTTVRFSGGPQRWAILVERAASDVSVCVAPIEVGRGVFCGFDQLAARVYHELLARKPWRPWSGVSPERLRFYSYVPWGRHVGGSEMFAARSLSWDGRSFVEDDSRRRSFSSVPQVIAALDPQPASPHMLIATPSAEDAAKLAVT